MSDLPIILISASGDGGERRTRGEEENERGGGEREGRMRGGT